MQATHVAHGLILLATTAFLACEPLTQPQLGIDQRTAHDLSEVCGFAVAGQDPECIPATDPDPTQAGVWIMFSPNDCLGYGPAGSYDPDEDGYINSCENRLAVAFAPQLIMTSDCSWDNEWDRLGGEYFWAVAPHPTRVNAARIAYLPAYYRDCGAGAGIGSLISGPHSGDAEFIIVDVSYLGDESRHWVVDRIFLSAHCGHATEACQWYDWTSFEWTNETGRGGAVIWVALAKHANYPSHDACNDWTVDICYSDYYVDFPAVSGHFRNVGNLENQFNNCVTPRYSDDPDLVDPNAVECLWAVNGRFNGWQGDTWGSGPSPYGNVLRDFLFCSEKEWTYYPLIGLLPSCANG